jgi:hypothetical protein
LPRSLPASPPLRLHRFSPACSSPSHLPTAAVGCVSLCKEAGLQKIPCRFRTEDTRAKRGTGLECKGERERRRNEGGRLRVGGQAPGSVHAPAALQGGRRLRGKHSDGGRGHSGGGCWHVSPPHAAAVLPPPLLLPLHLPPPPLTPAQPQPHLCHTLQGQHRCCGGHEGKLLRSGCRCMVSIAKQHAAMYLVSVVEVHTTGVYLLLHDTLGLS